MLSTSSVNDNMIIDNSENQPCTTTMPSNEQHDNDEQLISDEDDFHDLPMNFDDDDFLFDELADDNGDREFLRSATRTLISSLSDMDAASLTMKSDDAPRSIVYGDDFIVMMKNRQLALAFLQYTKVRLEQRLNPDKFLLLASLKKQVDEKEIIADRHPQRHGNVLLGAATMEPTLFSSIETKGNKKRRHKRAKKKKGANHKNDQRRALFAVDKKNRR
jgi:hypothetical protein